MLTTRPVDFRKGMDGLAMLVRGQLGADPFSGTVLCFSSRRADRLVSVVVMIAVAVNDEGKREIVVLHIGSSEAEINLGSIAD